MKRLCIITALMVMACTVHAFDFNFGFNLGGGSKVQYIDLAPVMSPWENATLTFPDTNTGSSSVLTNAFTNSGTDFLEDCKVYINGPDAAMFRNYSATGAAFFNLSASRTFSTKVKCTPTSAGAKTAYLNYTAPNITKRTATLTCTGVDTNPPTTPVISVTPGDTQNVIALTSGGVGATSFDLLWGLSAGSEPNTIASVSLPYTHTGRTNGTAYYYKLNAINANGTATSSEVSGTPAAPPAATPPDWAASLDDNAANNTVIASIGGNGALMNGGSAKNTSVVHSTSHSEGTGSYLLTSTVDYIKTPGFTPASSKINNSQITIQFSYYIPTSANISGQLPRILTTNYAGSETNIRIYLATDTSINIAMGGSGATLSGLDDMSSSSWQTMRIVIDRNATNKVRIFQGANEAGLTLKATSTSVLGDPGLPDDSSLYFAGGSINGTGLKTVDGYIDDIKVWFSSKAPGE